ncbi:bifunctional helix-turn-helix transcriptional regulator/GNAT family N-acetyltransferase [Actinoplanes couchii]|uniref:Transcriptional regulator, MarR family protein n=1 Tax=Actinoplanes couchii TaxID=403638 RepID=A0ABQ3X1L8_9ACTN|nr:bifunctional helix-turn-helix transcriptional regulator/GNAT family N-acetyltransferase [Actinoplanes couchii]MDR6316807.1 DNA-binding MarR family transcriptional regulator/GNAT superfamily N-acetyltransferase [Actinoplanes couchii]GID52414.1 putative transcriptional regulator, MarR family protein [Actinoplanes couchii]
MTADAIDRIRDFNRFYTQRIGLLTDHYLGQDRPLGPARLLGEIGEQATVRELRTRLGLDSGYLSRLLRTLEDQLLVRVGPHPSDARSRIVTPTPAGRAERAALDDRSRAGIAGLIDGLTPTQQSELVAAQDTVRRLLRLAAVPITPVPADDAETWECLRAYAAELAGRFPEGYDETTLTPAAAIDGALLLARPAAGCGAWVRLEPGMAEIRHLWVAPHARGIGLGRRLLAALEADAASHGVTIVRLGTHAALTEAAGLYLTSGYHEINGYSASPYNQICFEKDLR